ncbi:daunorubicin resistance protein DrrA family ABC transporter ATP-binding protein [Actinotalea caeni]|uniref:ABC transporter ATP-binding protein n=1 Tax=Actinotalea caeni TaxID=1348467 RepID=UPI0023DCCD79|nr:ABC transporter ATP-binding protein [Actinotalea caeni]
MVGLRREFGGRRGQPVVAALQGVDLSVPSGEIHGLLGPNGAGKTTLCKILSTVLLPTSGRAEICGYDVVTETAAVRRLIGIVFGGERGLYTRLTARANLEFWAALYGLHGADARRRVDALLERLGLERRADERVETYSRGMKQRLHLARGLIGDPRVLILDEPTIGMDPVAAEDFRWLVTSLRSEGRTILVTTHDMSEAEAICDRVTLIDNGTILATERPSTLGTWITRYARVRASALAPEQVAPVVAAVSEISGVADVREISPGTLLVDTAADGAAPAVLRRLLELGVTDVATTRPDLAEVYLRVIGNRGMRVDR